MGRINEEEENRDLEEEKRKYPSDWLKIVRIVEMNQDSMLFIVNETIRNNIDEYTESHNLFITVLDRYPTGREDVQIVTCRRYPILKRLCVERNMRFENHKDDRTYEQIVLDEQPFLTEQEVLTLVDANRDVIKKVGNEGLWYEHSTIEPINGQPFSIKLAQACCDRANEKSKGQNRGMK